MNASSTLKDPLPAPARRRWRKPVLILGIPVLLGLLLAGVMGYLHVANAWRWQAAFAEADRLDPGWRWEDLKAQQPELADEDNAAVAMAAFERLFRATNGSDGSFISTELAGEMINDTLNRLSANVQMTGAEIKLVNDELVRQAAALHVLRQLAHLPYSRTDPVLCKDFLGKLPTVQSARAAVNLLRWDVYLRSQRGDIDGALDSCRGMFHAGRAAMSDATLITCWIRVTCQLIALQSFARALAQGEPSESALLAMQHLLETEEMAPILLMGVRGERAFLGLPPEVCGADDPDKNWGIQLGPPGTSWDAIAEHHFKRWKNRVTERDLLDHFEWSSRLAEELKQLPVEDHAACFSQEINRMDKQIRSSILPSALRRLYLSIYRDKASKFMRHRAALGCALIGIAAERYRRATGQWPASLEALTPDYLERLPKDPFNGQKIILKRDADGLLVYTVGDDGIDDGGKLDWNILRPMSFGTDIGTKLWDVAQRRQPAK